MKRVSLTILCAAVFGTLILLLIEWMLGARGAILFTGKAALSALFPPYAFVAFVSWRAFKNADKT